MANTELEASGLTGANRDRLWQGLMHGLPA
jgi:hypothetical protein